MKHAMTFLMIFSSFAVKAVEIEKAKKFLEKKKACRVAFSSVIRGNQVPREIYCVFDGRGNKGTIKEFSGCFLGRYNMDTDLYRPIFDAGAGMMARSQPNGPCTKKLVTDILTKYPSGEWLQFSKSSKPVLEDVRENDSSVSIIFDEWGVVTPAMLKSRSKKKSSEIKLKDPRKIDCKNEWRSDPDDEVYCSTPEEIVAQCANLNLGKDERELRAAVYQMKTGESLKQCGRE